MMRVLFLFLMLSGSLQAGCKKAVTHELGGGRFGDQCIGYMHAKWISYRYGIPLLYQPFPYSEKLVMHREERRFKKLDVKRYEEVIRPFHGLDIDYEEDRSVLYNIPYFPEALSEHENSQEWYYFKVDWKDPAFKQELQHMIQPTKFQPLIQFPAGRVPVAVHVRLGGGYDGVDTWRHFVLKLPPLSFYQEQIRHMYELFNNEPLYIYIFTDDRNPGQLLEAFREATQDLDIQYDCRLEGNTHDSHVLQDLFEMVRFKGLIHPQSNYSIVASKIGNYSHVISPVHFIWIDSNTVWVDEVLVE